LKDTTRAASIVAEVYIIVFFNKKLNNFFWKTECILVALDRMSFKRLLGPLEDILVRNQSKYQKYMNWFKHDWYYLNYFNYILSKT
jgi:hypothetical protein